MLMFPPWVLPVSTVKTPHGKSQVRRCAQVFPEPLTPRPASRSAFSVVVQSKKENRGRRDWIGGGGSREHTISPQPISPTLLQAPSLDRKPAIYKCTTDGWISQRRAWQPTPVFLAGESHGQRSLAGYSPWGHKESGTTEQLTLSLVGYIF